MTLLGSDLFALSRLETLETNQMSDGAMIFVQRSSVSVD